MSESLIKRNAEGLTQNTVANMISPYVNTIGTGMVVWVLTKLETISGWSAGWKIALIVGVAAVLTFLLQTLPSLFRRNNPSADQITPAPVVSESTRLIELRDDLDAMRRERDTTQGNLENCWTEQKRTIKKLEECESLRRLEAGEVDKVTRHYEEQVRLARDQCTKSDAKVSEREQQLGVSQAKADELETRLSTPKGLVRLKSVRYIATASRPGGELSEAGRLPEKDLKQFFEDKYFTDDGKLVIPRGLYRKLFGRHNDPLEGTPKLLEIRFVHAGNEMSVLLPENISVTLPFPYVKTSEDVT